MHYPDFIKDPIFKKIRDTAAQLNVETYLVGGYVRDMFLKRNCKDIDVMVVGSGIALAEQLAKNLGKQKVNVFKNFGTAQLTYKDLEIEFVGARKESYRSESRKPIVEDGTLEDDLSRRDFTINAMAIQLYPDFGLLVDNYNGLKDLDAKRLITPLEPNITFSDDPLRMMRAIRFASQLDFDIEAFTFESIQANAERIKIVSEERITDELNKIILSPKPSLGFKFLYYAGLLKIIFPEMQNLQGVKKVGKLAHKDNFLHTLKVLDNISETTDDLWLRWAAILHDIAKPATQRFEPGNGWTFHGHEDLGARMVPGIFQRLKLPLNEKMKYVQKLVKLHLRPIALTKTEVTDSAVRRLLFEAGEDIEDLMKLCRADITSGNEQKVIKYLKNYDFLQKKIVEIEQKDHLRNWQPPITGADIMETFGIKAGKEVGIIKSAIREAILDGEIENQRASAFNYMLKIGKDLGLEK